MNRECFIYVERTRQIWPSTHVGHMSDTGIGKTRLNRVTSAYQEIKKKKILGTSQTCSRHGSDMPGMSQTRDSVKKILIFTPGPLPTIDQTKSLQPLSHSLSLPLMFPSWFALSHFPST